MMDVLGKAIANATAHLGLPPPESEEARHERIDANRRGAENLAKLLELSGPEELMFQLRVARWDGERIRRESEVIGVAIRFREAIAQGLRERAWAQETSLMASLLVNGPVALSGLNLDSLVKLVSKTVLKATSRDYDPFAEGGRLIAGPTGVGKSVCGVAVLRRLLDVQPEDQAWVLPQERFERMHAGKGSKRARRVGYCRAFDLPNARLALALGRGEADAVERAKAADFLVLDDLGWESKRAGADDVVTEVIAARYDAGLVTYATTGLRLDTFAERYGDAVIRRLTEAGGLPGKVIDLW